MCVFVGVDACVVDDAERSTHMRPAGRAAAKPHSPCSSDSFRANIRGNDRSKQTLTHRKNKRRAKSSDNNTTVDASAAAGRGGGG